MTDPLAIDPDIAYARSLPAALYCDPQWFVRVRERVFARTWHLVADAADVAAPGSARPVVLAPGMLDEPLVLTRDEAGALHCLSNVCTHRANLVVDEPCRARGLRCRYHGRRFGLDGRFVSMPEFEGAREFPAASDDLPRVPHATLGRFVFASVAPAYPLADALGPLAARLAALDLAALRFDPATSRDYEVRANWALYCDNYLEGFHIPYVHAALNRVLDYGHYRTETFPGGSLQVGIADGAEGTFALPPDHPDAGQRVAAYYAFLFPATMLNLYPWGLSINVVEPLAVDRTRVRFLSYVFDAARRAEGAGADLHRVELEDEAVVEAVQRGVRSRFYDRGRYSPTREIAVHHFHRTLVRLLDDAPAPRLHAAGRRD